MTIITTKKASLKAVLLSCHAFGVTPAAENVIITVSRDKAQSCSIFIQEKRAPVDKTQTEQRKMNEHKSLTSS